MKRVPDVAKRMSRSFVERVIAADTIWDENDVSNKSYCDHKGRKYSRYNNNRNPNQNRKSKRSSVKNDNNTKPNHTNTNRKHTRTGSNGRRHSLPSNIYANEKYVDIVSDNNFYIVFFFLFVCIL